VRLHGKLHWANLLPPPPILRAGSCDGALQVTTARARGLSPSSSRGLGFCPERRCPCCRFPLVAGRNAPHICIHSFNFTSAVFLGTGRRRVVYEIPRSAHYFPDSPSQALSQLGSSPMREWEGGNESSKGGGDTGGDGPASTSGRSGAGARRPVRVQGVGRWGCPCSIWTACPGALDK